MTVLIHPTSGLTIAAAEIEAWRTIPVAVANPTSGAAMCIDPPLPPQ